MRLVIKTLRLLSLILLLPWLHLEALWYRRINSTHRHARIRFWSSVGLKLLGKKLVVHHQERGYGLSHTLIVCNHQGLIDPLPILCAIKSPMSFVSKQENRKILGIGAWGDTINLVYFDRDSLEGNVKMLRECTQAIRSGRNMLIFPEGTRSKSDRMNPFKSKAFGIVKMAKANILPISLSHAYDPFNDTIHHPITITIHPLIEYNDIKDMDVETLSNTLYDIISSKVESTTLHT